MVTDTQLYIAIAVLTFAVLVGILMDVIHHNAVNARFNSVDARFNGIEARFNSIEARFNNFETFMNERFNRLDSKFDTLTGVVIALNNRVTRIGAKLGIN